MSTTVAQIKSAILNLLPQELTQLVDWVTDLDEQQWDRQIERDAATGKLDFLAREAFEELESGDCQIISNSELLTILQNNAVN
jgi:hypothetical protein